MDSFTNIQDLESIADNKNVIYSFAPSAQSLGPTAGHSVVTPPTGPSFDVRVGMIFADDITPDTVGSDLSKLNVALQEKANVELQNRKVVKLVDGEIVQTGQIQFGVDYFLGDIVEVEGNTGVLQKARVTEYIRSKDTAGERAYPTLSMID